MSEPHKNTVHGMARTPTYKSWKGMKSRCLNKADIRYDRYGGRGIRVCERWLDFNGFLADMGEKPPGRTSIERQDNDGNYEPGNCRWATNVEQSNNKSNNDPHTYAGITLNICQWADARGIARSTLRNRLHRFGWEFGRAISTGAGKSGPVTLHIAALDGPLN